MRQTILPVRCLVCLTPVEQQGTLCATCWPQLNFISQPYCVRCGLTFEYKVGAQSLCVFCSQKNPVFKMCRSALVYDDHSKSLVLGFKHSDRLWGTPIFAQWMAKVGEDVLLDADVLIPVPLHWSRLLMRRYNQAALLSNALSQLMDVVKDNHALKRRKATPSQGKRTRLERLQNVRGAFCVPKRARARLLGKTCVLVDDVYTTGATIEECSRTLLDAGAGQVRVLTLARVV
ncbi:MAG: ComF family protein [Pseudomonadota bacterium]